MGAHHINPSFSLNIKRPKWMIVIYSVELRPVILYFSYLIYGYIFLFAVYSFSQFLSLFLQWEYSTNLAE
ncbi:MAG: hypothetical protein ACTSRK_16920, partial [Promethearchaeota archaeon]